jgi:hypothetical protein
MTIALFLGALTIALAVGAYLSSRSIVGQVLSGRRR